MKIIDIPLNELAPFKNPAAFPREYAWYYKVKKIIDYIGLQILPVAFRKSEKRYELLCHYNCVHDAKMSGRDNVTAFVVEEFTDEAEIQIAVQSHPDRMPFKDWEYKQKIRLIKTCNHYIQRHSQQGKRTDLAEISTCVQSKYDINAAEETCVQNQKSVLENDLTYVQSKSTPSEKPARLYISNIIAGLLGISSTALKRYRQVAKLDDHTLDILSKGVDQGRVDSTAAYRIAQLKPGERDTILDLLKNNSEAVLTNKDLEMLYAKSKESKENNIIVPPLPPFTRG